MTPRSTLPQRPKSILRQPSASFDPAPSTIAGRSDAPMSTVPSEPAIRGSVSIPTGPRALREREASKSTIPAVTPPAAKPPAAAAAAATAGIPPHASVAACIFTPIQRDLAQGPPNPPRDAVERIRQILKNLDDHSDHVTANLIAFFDQQRDVYLEQFARLVEERPEDLDTHAAVMGPAESDALIAAMKMPAEPGVNYNIEDKDIPPPAFGVPFPEESPRMDMLRALLYVFESSIFNTRGYQLYSDKLKAQYRELLQVELKRAARYPD